MNYLITNRTPASLFHYFEEISAIPRCSGNEEKIADYIVSFAEQHGLFCKRDAKNNVFIRKSATKGWENKKPILFQGHLDMVGEKETDCNHDFKSEGLTLKTDGKYLFANKTTLGADDGTAIALMLSLLDGTLKEHPTLECLFTTSEETGMDGAKAFDYRLITARTLINMDSEQENTVTCGCAGGVRSDVTFRYEETETEGDLITLSVSDFAGGHSGVEIHRGRQNAILFVLSLLQTAIPYSFCLSAINGGEKDNAIPRSCSASFFVSNADSVKHGMEELAEKMRLQMNPEDSNFQLKIAVYHDKKSAFSTEYSRKILTTLETIPCNVLKMKQNIPTLVEYSRNLGIVKTSGNTVQCTYSSRSDVKEYLDETEGFFQSLSSDTISVSNYARYPSWQYREVSDIRKKYADAYRKITGKEIQIEVIHAGLECGLIVEKIPYMDIISVGPQIYGIHTPQEKLDLASMETFYRIVEEVIKEW